MFRRFSSILLVLVALGAAPPGFAATVVLQPSSAVINTGDTFTVDVFMDAADVMGDHPGSFCGSIVIDYDPAAIEFQDFAIAEGGFFVSSPLGHPNGGRATVTLDFEDALDVGVIVTFTFVALTTPGVTDIGIGDADPFFGSFANHLPTNQPFMPEFSGTTIEIVQAIPLPAAAWLMLSGLGLLTLRRRRATQ